MSKRIAVLLLAVVFLFGAGLVGCGGQKTSQEPAKSDQTTGTTTPSQQEPKKDELSGSITAGGATALQPLVQAAAEAFMKKHPNVKITVQGGGSGTGLSKVIEGAFDIGNSDIFCEEKKELKEQGKCADLVDHKVAVVVMAAVANKDAGVDNLTKDQLVDIFTGKIKNWKEVGGADLKITVVGRPEGSGTRATFKKYALGGQEEQADLQENSSNKLKEMIASTPGAIGYLATSYVKPEDTNIVALKIDGVAPTKENVVENKYTIWAYEHMYTKGQPTGVIKEFLDYIMTDPEVQGPGGIVEKQGYIPTKDMKVERDVEGNVTPKK
ncbi:MAG TPA: phosphate ABC transporter substrate-binding protein [Bacillaceae bacterium]|nr:phosphate ABC transporter substrate-binding protein [Bacillaceae bacterium]